MPVRPIRVAHLLWRLGMGGMEVGVVKLVNNLDRRLVASSICSFNPADDLKLALAPDVQLHEFRRRGGNDPRLVWQLWRLFRRTRPDIVHTHRWGTLLEGLIAGRCAGVPIVIHGEHGTMELRPRNRVVQRILWNRVDQVLSVSSLLAEKMSREVAFPMERIKTIRNGVDFRRFDAGDRRQGRRKLGLTDADLVIGTVGRLVAVKDQTTLLDALAAALQAGLECRGVIVGDGPLQSDLEARARALRLHDRVVFAGARSDVPDMLAALDIFVLSSVSEGLSNVIQEAMTVGLPVIATRVGGAAELVEDEVTGLLVPASDVQAMADALLRVGRNRGLREEMAKAGRSRAEREFTLDSMIRAYEKLYVSIAASHLGYQHNGRLSEA